jgi:hypothetical protein
MEITGFLRRGELNLRNLRSSALICGYSGLVASCELPAKTKRASDFGELSRAVSPCLRGCILNSEF